MKKSEIDAKVESRLKLLENGMDAKSPNAENTSRWYSGVVESGQAYILMYLLAIVEVTKQEFEDAHTDYRNIAPEKLATSLIKAGAMLVDSGDTVVSLLTAAGTHRVFRIPLEILNKVIENSELKPIFKSLLQNLAGSLVTFVGWDFGTQLWNEAGTLIEIEALGEDERALVADSGKLWSNIYYALKGTLDAKDPQVLKSRKILELMSQNMVRILLTDPELRLQWVYNALRQRIFTGTFATMVGTVVVASAVGTTLFPGAGTILGMMFGVGGGLASMMIPEEIKNEISMLMKDIWVQAVEKSKKDDALNRMMLDFDEDGVHTHQMRADGIVSKVMSWVSTTEGAKPVDIKYNLYELYKKREQSREYLVDVYLERLYLFYTAAQTVSFEVVENDEKLKKASVANAADSATSVTTIIERRKRLMEKKRSLVHELTQYQDWYSEAMVDLLELYSKDIQLYYDLGNKRATTQPTSKVTESYFDEMRNGENVLGYFCSMFGGILLMDQGINQNLSTLSAEKRGRIDLIRDTCQLKAMFTATDVEKLSEPQRELYGQAQRSLRFMYLTHFTEGKTSVERLRAIADTTEATDDDLPEVPDEVVQSILNSADSDVQTGGRPD
jgi:hypothetical protein